jgi:hypothetical protein
MSTREAKFDVPRLRSPDPACSQLPVVPKHERSTKYLTGHPPPASASGFTAGNMLALTSTEAYSLSLLSVVCISVLVNAWRSDGEPLFASLAISGVAFAFSYALIPWTGDVFMRRGFKGKDLSKKNPVEL